MDTTGTERVARDGRALAAAGTTVLLWASAFVAIRDAGSHFGPGALALGRLLVGSVALLALLLRRGEGLPPRAAWPGIAASGVLWFGVYLVALNWGEQKVDAGTAAMVVNIGPLLIALLGGLVLREGFPGRWSPGWRCPSPARSWSVCRRPAPATDPRWGSGSAWWPRRPTRRAWSPRSPRSPMPRRSRSPPSAA
ncbi:hypothetical protein GCM10025734_65280 [Kitasatospora paranensis]